VHTRASFLASFPEFSECDVAVVDAKLAEASRRIDTTVWEQWSDDGHGQLTAHLLANSPLGNSAKLQAKGGKDPKTVYEGEFNRLQRMVACGIRST
jgi:hypothetical protein